MKGLLQLFIHSFTYSCAFIQVLPRKSFPLWSNCCPLPAKIQLTTRLYFMSDYTDSWELAKCPEDCAVVHLPSATPLCNLCMFPLPSQGCHCHPRDEGKLCNLGGMQGFWLGCFFCSPPESSVEILCRSVVEDLRWQLHLQHRVFCLRGKGDTVQGNLYNHALCREDRGFYITGMVILSQYRVVQ